MTYIQKLHQKLVKSEVYNKEPVTLHILLLCNKSIIPCSDDDTLGECQQYKAVQIVASCGS